jgi:hypothetical protein
VARRRVFREYKSELQKLTGVRRVSNVFKVPLSEPSMSIDARLTVL